MGVMEKVWVVIWEVWEGIWEVWAVVMMGAG